MKRLKSKLFFAFLCVFWNVNAQTNTLSWEEFKRAIEQYHPIAQKASLLPKYAVVEIGMARAAFDPVLDLSQSEKSIQNINYYTAQNIALKLPLWYGIDINSGSENLLGQRLNPSDTKGQLFYIGANVPLMRNLITDKRRTALRQAYLSREMSVLEKQIQMNDLLFEAAQVYWDWTKAYANLIILDQGVKNLTQRVQFLHQNILHGERAEIDSIELDLTLQSFLTRKNQAELDWQNACLQVSAYLWKENGQAYELPSNAVPNLNLVEKTSKEISQNASQPLVSDLLNHPMLFWYDKKMGQLKLEQKLKRQELLPKLDLKYNRWVKQNYSIDYPLNYTFGLQLQMPMTMAFSRNQYKAVKLKIEETEWSRLDKQRQINLKFSSYLKEAESLKLQLQSQEASVLAAQLLLNAERQKFDIGESSVFMINQREQKYLESLEKLVELKAKSMKVQQSILWAQGSLATP